MDKKSIRIELSEEEREILDRLQAVFNLNTRNATIRHIIQLAREKYL